MAQYVIPHEASVRVWLSRSRVAQEDAEELIQEAYCRLAVLDTVDHIDRADAYFFSIVRNLLARRMRRERIVAIEAIAEIESFVDVAPSPEQQVGGALDFARVSAFIDSLPGRCGTIVRLRKIEGWSQKEIAAHFGMSENAVEKQIWLGVRAVRRLWHDANAHAAERMALFEQESRSS